MVERGQTLWRIARAYGVDLEKLQWVNDIDDVTRLAAGRRIFIPGALQALKVEPYRPGETALPVARLAESLAWPLNAGPSSGFGPREGEPHRGIDLPALEGKPIEAAAGGRVVYSGRGMRGYGNVVVIKHNDDISTVYAHNAINLVKEGRTVEKGEVIAEVGRTGRATGPHLHFEVRVRGVPQDPMRYLPPTRGN